MLIKMDTRPVDAFKLAIWSGDILLFEDVIFSEADVKINLLDFHGGTLTLKWSFKFDNEEKEKLKEREDFPREGFSSFYIENDVEGASDKLLYGSFMGSAAEGIYYTIIENIKPSCDTIKLAFVEVVFAGGLLLLDVSSKGNLKFGRTHFKRRENIEEFLIDSKHIFNQKIKQYRMFTYILNFVFVSWLLLWFILGELSFSTFVLDIFIGGFALVNFINYRMQTKSYKEYVRDCTSINAFRLNNDKIEVLEK